MRKGIACRPQGSAAIPTQRTARPATTAICAPLETSASPASAKPRAWTRRSEEHTSELQSLRHLVCCLLFEKKIGFSTELTRASPATPDADFGLYPGWL